MCHFVVYFWNMVIFIFIKVFSDQYNAMHIITEFVIRRAPLEEQEMLIIPDNLSSLRFSVVFVLLDL